MAGSLFGLLICVILLPVLLSCVSVVGPIDSVSGIGGC